MRTDAAAAMPRESHENHPGAVTGPLRPRILIGSKRAVSSVHMSVYDVRMRALIGVS